MDTESLSLFLKTKRIRVKFKEDNSCFLCISHSSINRYTPISYEGKMQLLHRLIYFLLHPAADSTLVVRHSCNNTKCCNPSHLTIGTQQDNIKDMVKADRHHTSFHGTTNPHAKLNKNQVIAIRASRKSNIELAKDFKVSVTTVSHIKNYRTYKDIIP